MLKQERIQRDSRTYLQFETQLYKGFTRNWIGGAKWHATIASFLFIFKILFLSVFFSLLFLTSSILQLYTFTIVFLNFALVKVLDFHMVFYRKLLI